MGIGKIFGGEIMKKNCIFNTFFLLVTIVSFLGCGDQLFLQKDPNSKTKAAADLPLPEIQTPHENESPEEENKETRDYQPENLKTDVVDPTVYDQIPEEPKLPQIFDVTDLGQDGMATIGEWVRIRGENLDTNCAVLFDTLIPAALRNVQTNSIEFQVPEGIAVGEKDILLRCKEGIKDFTLDVTRYVLVALPQDGEVAVLEEVEEGLFDDVGYRIIFQDVEHVMLSHDSSHSYISTGKLSIKLLNPAVGIVDMTAGGGPQLLPVNILREKDIQLPITSLATSPDFPLLAISDGISVDFYDITTPSVPLYKNTITFFETKFSNVIPEVHVNFFVDVAINSLGDRACLLDGAGDRLRIFDITDIMNPKEIHDPIKISNGDQGVSVPIEIPIDIPGLGNTITVGTGVAQEVEISPDGLKAVVLSGGGLGAMVPETYNLNLKNTTISVVNTLNGEYINQLEYLEKAQFPFKIGFSQTGDAYVSAFGSQSFVLLQILFEIGKIIVVTGGLDLPSLATIFFDHFKDFIDIVLSAFNGSLFHLGAVYQLKDGVSAANGGYFETWPYAYGGLDTTYDDRFFLASGGGFRLDLQLQFSLQFVKKFEGKLDFGFTQYPFAEKKDGAEYFGLTPIRADILLPPYGFGEVSIQK